MFRIGTLATVSFECCHRYRIIYMPRRKFCCFHIICLLLACFGGHRTRDRRVTEFKSFGGRRGRSFLNRCPPHSRLVGFVCLAPVVIPNARESRHYNLCKVASERTRPSNTSLPQSFHSRLTKLGRHYHHLILFTILSLCLLSYRGLRGRLIPIE